MSPSLIKLQGSFYLFRIHPHKEKRSLILMKLLSLHVSKIWLISLRIRIYIYMPLEITSYWHLESGVAHHIQHWITKFQSLVVLDLSSLLTSARFLFFMYCHLKSLDWCYIALKIRWNLVILKINTLWFLPGGGGGGGVCVCVCVCGYMCNFLS